MLGITFLNTMAQMAPVIAETSSASQPIEKIGLNLESLAAISIAVATIAALTANLDKIFSFRDKYFSRDAVLLSEYQLSSRRRQLLKQMKTDVAKRLEDSLHNLIRVDLEQAEVRHQVGRRRETQETGTSQPAKSSFTLIQRLFRNFKNSPEKVSVSTAEKTYSIFHRNDIGGRLLILGEPGAGKTTELLSTAERLIQDAFEDSNNPIPLIFELSSWTPNTSILVWLSQQLQKKYGVSKEHSSKLIHQWIQQNSLMLLLDGLDELSREDQIACMHSLEKFLEEHRALSALICCRREEYEQSGQKIRQLNGAIYLRPVEKSQVHQYLKDLGQETLWKNIQARPAIMELAQSPLFLTMLVIVDKGQPILDKTSLFNAYIQQQIHDPSHQGTYKPGTGKTPDQTLHYLSWLAQQLEERKETEFLIESLQPNWILSNQQRTYRWIAGLIFSLIFSLIGSLYSVLFIGLIGTLLNKLLNQREGVKTTTKLKWASHDWLDSGLIGAIVGTMMGVTIGGLSGGGLISMGIATLGGLPGGIIGWGLGGRGKIESTEKLQWASRGKLTFGLILGLFSGLFFGLVFGFSNGFAYGVILGIGTLGVIIGLALGAMMGLLIGLMYGITFGVESEPLQQKHVPNQGIKKSVQNAIRVALLFGLIGALVVGFISATLVTIFDVPINELSEEPFFRLRVLIFGLRVLVFGLIGGLIFGILSGPIGALFGGLVPAIQHFSLRIVLTRRGYTPWNYSKFLEHSVQHRFIQRTGGRYRFIHDLLRKHFARMTLEQQKILAQGHRD